MSKINLNILTPYGKYMSSKVDFIEVQTVDYLLGILPKHTPLVSTLVISQMKIKNGNDTKNYAIGGGILQIDENGNVLLLLDSIEYEKEIDIERAISAKDRAEKRLNDFKDKKDFDDSLTKLALARALNRLRVVGKQL